MQIITRRIGDCVNVEIEADNIKIDLGMMDEKERDNFAKTLIEAVWEIGPQSCVDCERWMKELIENCGIDLE